MSFWNIKSAQQDFLSTKWHIFFESKEEHMQTVNTFKADEGLKQNTEKLDKYLQAQLSVGKQ